MPKKRKNNQTKEKSLCCNAKVKVVISPDFYGDNPKTQQIGTCHYECIKCKKVCDVYLKERKIWIRNPKTQIIPNKKKLKFTKLTPKEIQEIRMNEDF